MKIEIYGQHNLNSDQEILSIVKEFYEIFNIDINRITEIQFVSADEIKQINNQYRQIDKATDVLSFPQAKASGFQMVFGTIVICIDKALEYNESIKELVKHGLLHLAEFDHETDSKKWREAANKIKHNMG